MPKAQTWVIIVKFKEEKEVEPRPFSFPNRPIQGGANRVKVTESVALPVDKPLLLLPDGETDTVEIIPITSPTTIHGRNLKRVL